MAKEDLRVLTSASYAGPGDAGRTGSWRVLRPVIDYTKCAPAKSGKPSCFYCWLYCPDTVVTRTLQPQIDLTYCKGCGICAEECPPGAITMVEETSFASTQDPAQDPKQGDPEQDPKQDPKQDPEQAPKMAR